MTVFYHTVQTRCSIFACVMLSQVNHSLFIHKSCPPYVNPPFDFAPQIADHYIAVYMLPKLKILNGKDVDIRETVQNMEDTLMAKVL